MGYGLIVSYYKPDNGQADLNRGTEDLIRQLQSENPRMQVGKDARPIRVGGEDALETILYSNSPYQSERREVDMLVTVARPQGMFYMVFVTPDSEFDQAQPAYAGVLRSVSFR